jgi:tetratricopeptide (TPR) repeat protein
MSALRLTLALLLALLVAPASSEARKAPAAPADEAPEEVDRLALAALLVRDEHYDRAENVLAEVDPADPGLDLPRYHLLLGVVHLATGRPAEAAADFAASAAAGNATAGIWLLRSRAHRELGEWGAAASALDEGALRFPDNLEIERQGVLLRVELGLYQEASERGQRWLSRAGEEVDSWLVLAQAFQRSGRTEESLVLLEEARMRFPVDVAVTRQLAGTWLAAGRPLAAGNLLRVAAESDPALYSVAAECFRRAGHLPTALQLNALVPDPLEQARQRLGLLVEAEDWERAASLGPRLSRLGLLDDASVRYGLAYARFQTGEHEASDALLSGIADPAVFQLALRLREAIAACTEDPLPCL